jgi:glutamyl-tRNA synthetase
MDRARTRFAPAPSGHLHVGNSRTALFNWLWARHTGGEFVLRVEDTDTDRVTVESAEGMLAGLRWLGLHWDEGPGVDGPYGPYVQSQRRALYEAVIERLREAGALYDAYETPEELTAARDRALAEGRPPGYDGAHRHLTDEQRARYLAEGRRPTLRLRTPDEGTVAWDDQVRGRIEVAWSTIPDFVLSRADATPTYYLANTVDDLAMGITLVARGEDLLSATPRQLLLHGLLLADGLLDDALAQAGHPARPVDALEPVYAHLPVIVGADRKKLSKRHGDVAVDAYRQAGYLADVLVNFIALCGWSWDATTEQMTIPELIDRFGFDRVGSNPAYFDTDKLRAFNGDRIKRLGDAELVQHLQTVLADAGLLPPPPDPAQVRLLHGFAPLVRDRIQTLAEAVPLIGWCFTADVRYDDDAVAKHLRPPADRVLDVAAADLATLPVWQADTIHGALDGVANKVGVGRGKAFQPIRVAVTGTAVSPPLPETLALLDRDLVVTRTSAARQLVQPS